MIYAEIRQITWACPAQFKGVTTDGLLVYVRYRWGYLSVTVGGEEVYGKQVGDGLDGVMGMDELRRHTAGLVDWTEI